MESSFLPSLLGLLSIPSILSIPSLLSLPNLLGLLGLLSIPSLLSILCLLSLLPKKRPPFRAVCVFNWASGSAEEEQLLVGG
jgi:hypothetical protein